MGANDSRYGQLRAAAGKIKQRTVTYSVKLYQSVCRAVDMAVDVIGSCGERIWTRGTGLHLHSLSLKQAGLCALTYNHNTRKSFNVIVYGFTGRPLGAGAD